MAVAKYQDLCIDTSGGETLGRFWAAALGLRFEPDGEAGCVVGDRREQRIWMNVVSEPKAVKHRVHLDVHAASIDELVGLGASVLEPAERFNRRWSVLADPEGGEFCAFVRDPAALPAYRLYEIGVDAARPQLIAKWWADVFGATLTADDANSWWGLEQIPGAPFEGLVFAPVPEPKTVKNRIHWDVAAESVDALTDAGATLLRPRDDEIGWHVMADPEGNEFCVFVGDD